MEITYLQQCEGTVTNAGALVSREDQEHSALYKVRLRKELLYKILQVLLQCSVTASLLRGPNKYSQQPEHL